MKEPYFSWDPETGHAICLIQDGNATYYGTAKCAPDDKDMMSEKTGCEIAWTRANISYMQKQKEKVRYQIEALQHYKSTVLQSKTLIIDDNVDYLFRRLNKEIYNLRQEHYELQSQIDVAKTRLREYIKDKDTFYKKIREKR